MYRGKTIKRIGFLISLFFIFFVILSCSLIEPISKGINEPTATSSSDISQFEESSNTQTNQGNLPTITNPPEKTEVSLTLDKSSTGSVIKWMKKAITDADINAMNSITAEKVAYVGNIAGGDWQDKSRFLRDLSQRFGSSTPKCEGEGFAEDGYMYVAWFSGWTPAWELIRSCGDECTTFDPPKTSDIVGFIFYNEKGSFELTKVWIAKPDQLVGVYPSLMGSCSSDTGESTNEDLNNGNISSMSSCPGAPAQRVKVGSEAQVCTKTDSIALRQTPAKDGDLILRLISGATFKVIDGPECSDNWSWWQIRTDNGTTGWVSEGGDDIDPYFICPLQ